MKVDQEIAVDKCSGFPRDDLRPLLPSLPQTIPAPAKTHPPIHKTTITTRREKWDSRVAEGPSVVAEVSFGLGAGVGADGEGENAEGEEEEDDEGEHQEHQEGERVGRGRFPA